MSSCHCCRCLVYKVLGLDTRMCTCSGVCSGLRYQPKAGQTACLDCAGRVNNAHTTCSESSSVDVPAMGRRDGSLTLVSTRKCCRRHMRARALSLRIVMVYPIFFVVPACSTAAKGAATPSEVSKVGSYSSLRVTWSTIHPPSVSVCECGSLGTYVIGSLHQL